MRVAVVADIHANATAFDAVRTDWGKVDEVWCLGDLVGYGPDPNECVQTLRGLQHLCIPGNHDWAALGKIDVEDFNPAARAAAEWTAAQLSSETKDYLSALPQVIRNEPFTLVHGSVISPIWEYLLDTGAAAASFEKLDTPYALIGHSHVPLAFVEEGGRVGGQLLHPGAPMPLAGARRILNPGSVGQPRDGDPRASYAILQRTDDGTWTFELRRIPYAIDKTQERMKRVGLPASLINRLAQGR